MLKHLIYTLFLILLTMIVLSSNNVNAQNDRIIRPDDVFPNNPQYRPPTRNTNKVKNPFSDTFNRDDPDELFLGFFPIWSAILASIAVIFGFIAIFGLIGYAAGCRNPNRILIKKTKLPKTKLPIYLDHDDVNEDAALRMLDVAGERDYENPFKNSRLATSLA